MAGKKKIEDLMKDPKTMKKVMEEAFRKVDIDGSGFLERGEFEQVLVQIAKEIGVDNPTREEVDDILDEIDENGDNRISRDEFSDLIEKVFQMIGTEDIWFAYPFTPHYHPWSHHLEQANHHSPFLFTFSTFFRGGTIKKLHTNSPTST